MSDLVNHRAIREKARDAYLTFRAALREDVAASIAADGTPPDYLMGHSGTRVTIPQEKLDGCKVLSNRKDIIRQMPSAGEVIEVGTQAGLFAEFILNLLPSISLRTIDVDYGPFRFDLLQPFINEGRLTTITGYSWEELSKFPDQHFEWIYIDASHIYEHVRKDLEVAKQKVKVGGYIVCNDYAVWSPLEGDPYGVMQAVNEFVFAENFKVSHLALDGWGYHDIALRRLS